MGDGTPPPHRDFKEKSVVLAVAHPNPWSSASFYLPSQSLADSRCNLHATSRSSHPLSSFSLLSLPPLVASLSSASSCDAAAACRSLGEKRKKTDNPREGWEDGTPPP